MTGRRCTTTMNMRKPELHQHCLNLLDEKINSLKTLIQEAQQSASEDTKSSAGDKFETGREMLKQEINKHNTQLAKTTEMRQQLQALHPEQVSEKIALGSLVLTNEGYYYLSVSLGKIEIEKTGYFLLTLASPLGKALLHREKGEEVLFMARKIVIKEVF